MSPTQKGATVTSEHDEVIRRVARLCKLTPEERLLALAAVRYYVHQVEHSPWGSKLTDRQRRIDEVVLSELVDKYKLNARLVRVSFDTARILAAQLRHGNAAAPPRPGKARVRSKKGRRG